MKLRGFFIIAVMASLSLQAQTPVEKDNGTIRTTASSLHKAGEELVVCGVPQPVPARRR